MTAVHMPTMLGAKHGLAPGSRFVCCCTRCGLLRHGRVVRVHCVADAAGTEEGGVTTSGW